MTHKLAVGVVEELTRKMITVFVKQGFTDTWDPYLRDWAGESRHDFAIRTYQNLASLHELPAQPVLFSDIERLSNADRALAVEVSKVLARHRPDIPILNNPERALRRYDLLTELYRRGMNPFRVYRLSDTVTPERFPVFLRYENDHTGAVTGLLNNQEELNQAILRSRIRQHDLRELLIVEFVDTRDIDGFFVKYGAFIVGQTIIARHIHRSDDWVVKYLNSVRTPEHSTFELGYVRDCPHESALRELFDIGSINYGRIDYSVLDGSIVTWEINTNPVIISKDSKIHPLDKQRQDIFLSRFRSAFRHIELKCPGLSPISLNPVAPELREAVRRQDTTNISNVQRFGRRYKHFLEPGVRAAELASVPIENWFIRRWKRLNRI